MHRQLLAAAAALTLLLPLAARAQVFPPSSGPRGNEDAVNVSAVGRVQSAQPSGSFTIQIRNLTYRVSYSRANGAGNRQEVRTGDRVRVIGEITATDQISADQVLVIERGRGGDGPGGGRPGRPSSVLSGTIRNIDRDQNELTVTTDTGNVRVTWDEDTEFYRNSTRGGPREFRQGERVRVVGRSRGGNEFSARRVLYGGSAGWQNAGIGEIVALDARQKEADVDFDGDVWTVKLATATIRRGGQRAELDDLRLGQDIRVTGAAARGPKTVDANLVEVVRSIDGDGRPGRPGGNDRPERPTISNTRTFEGKIVNVGTERKAFRIESSGDETRFHTDDQTTYRRGTTAATFNALREGARVKVEARKSGEDWIAVRVTIL